jgi:serine/arginine repetitive matrix protein 1
MGLLEDESQTVKAKVKARHPFCLTLWLILMNKTPDPKKIQICLTGFLTDSTPVFMAALWNLLTEAQTSPAGIPQSFVEEKKEEMRCAKEGDTRALTERDRRQRLDEIRDRERSERSDRGGGRGRGRGRRGRGGIGNDDRPRDNGWSSRGGGVSNPSLRFQYKEKNILSSLASTISLSPPFSLVSPRGRMPSSDRSSCSGGPPHRSRSRSPIRARSRSPPPRRRSPSLRSSSSSPPRRRRRRSPSFSPRDHERDRRSRRRDSRSPPPRRRRISPPPPPRGRTPSRSPDHARRRRSPSPRRTRKGRSLSSERSPPPPRRKRGERDRHQNRSRSRSRSRGAENGRGATKRPSSRSSRSRTRSPSPRKRHDEGKGRGRDLSLPNDPPSGIRIKGQAKAERQRNKMDTSEVRLSFHTCFIPGELMRAATGRQC